MAIAFINSTTGTPGQGTVGGTTTISLPSGLTSSSITVLTFDNWNGGGVTPFSTTPPSGWTAIAAALDDPDSTSGFVIRIYGWWALGSAPNTSFTNSGAVAGNSFQSWACLAFSGVDNATPIDATDAAGAANLGASSVTAQAVTVATANAWELIYAGDSNSGVFSATGFTKVGAGEGSANTVTSAFLYNTTPKGTGSTGTVSVSDSASATAQALACRAFALRPASAADSLGWLAGRWAFEEVPEELYYG